MAGLANICVGRRKTGKTTFAKKLLDESQQPIVVYDVNNEYKDYYNKKLVDFDVFLDEIVTLRHHYILMEEATIFFDTASKQKEMKNLLVRARHTGNIIHLNFHSFSSVPRSIYTLLDYVTVFKTNDSEEALKRFDSPILTQTYLKVRADPNEYAHETISLY